MRASLHCNGPPTRGLELQRHRPAASQLRCVAVCGKPRVSRSKRRFDEDPACLPVTWKSVNASGSESRTCCLQAASRAPSCGG
jgi:hypothetical protein